MSDITILPYNEIQLEFLIKRCMKDVLNEETSKNIQKTTSTDPEFITRKETCQILGVSLPTLNSFTKQGIIIGYRISSRVRYKKSEILEAFTKISTLKYRRVL